MFLPFHGGNRGSNPLRDATYSASLAIDWLFLCFFVSGLQAKTVSIGFCA